MPHERNIGQKVQDFGFALGGDFAALQNVRQSRIEQERFGQAQTKQLSQERREAAAEDFRNIGNLIRGGFTDRAVTAINKRKLAGGLLPDFQSDSTDFIKTLLETGDTEQALNFLDVADQAAVAGGFITARPQPQLIPSSAISDTGQFAQRDPSTGQVSIEQIPGFTAAARGGLASAVTRTYGNGTVLQALPNGTTEVRNPAGAIVIGQDRLDTLGAARQDELDFERTKAGAKAAGTQAIKVAGETFERLRLVDTAITNFDDAIAAIDAGAQTGPIISKLPSFRASSVQLDNIQGRLGLDVIGNTTFGALSESELAFALNTALPQRLEPQELRAWLVEKRDAQSKLRNYLEDAAIFLGVEGNTVSDWIEAQRELRNQRIDEGQAPAGPVTRIRFDAQGNQIDN